MKIDILKSVADDNEAKYTYVNLWKYSSIIEVPITRIAKEIRSIDCMFGISQGRVRMQKMSVIFNFMKIVVRRNTSKTNTLCRGKCLARPHGI